MGSGLAAALLMCLLTLPLSAQAGPQGFYGPLTEEVILKVLDTAAGERFARMILGPSVRKLNSRTSREFVNTLMHPDNRALADTVASRLKEIEKGWYEVRRAYSQMPGDRLAAFEKWFFESEMERLFLLDSAATRPGSSIVFWGGEEYAVRSAFAARRGEFLMNGAKVGIKAGRVRELPNPPKGYQPDAFEQFLQWEQLASLRQYRETEQFFGLKVAEVDASQVAIQQGSTLPKDIRDLFVRGDKILWPAHPYNQADHIPFYGAKAVEEWPARLTASRSMVIWDRAGGRAFSLKAPTDYPHRGEMQPGKAGLKDDIDSALVRSEYLDRFDARLGGPDSRITMLREMFTAAEKVSGNGFVVRDLSPLMDGNYYVPALSIPYVGKGIAQANGVAFERFWGKAYAELLGRSKARLLIRYGLQMETPNAQNMLIQLDRQMRPTGKLVFRDVSDSFTVESVLKALGEERLLAQDIAIGYTPSKELNAMTDNSFWRLDEDQVHGIADDVLSKWKKLHDQAYIDEVLGMTGTSKYSHGVRGIRTIDDLDIWLKSPAGGRAIRRYHGSQTHPN